jgi:hypothetical protein
MGGGAALPSGVEEDREQGSGLIGDEPWRFAALHALLDRNREVALIVGARIFRAKVIVPVVTFGDGDLRCMTWRSACAAG